MTIEEYLSKTRICFSVENCSEDEKLVSIFTEILQLEPDIDIEIIMVKSSKATCSTVKLNNKYYIVWDMRYWEMVYGYLVAVCMSDFEYNKSAQLFYTINVFSAAMLRLKDQDAYSASNATYETLKEMYENAFDEEAEKRDIDIGHIFDFLKLFTFRHEMLHILSNAKSKGFDFLKSVFSEYKLLIKEQEKKIGKKGICPYEFTDNQEIQDEIICDTWAYLFCAQSFPNLNIFDSKSFHADMIAIKNGVVDFYYDVIQTEKVISHIAKNKDVEDGTTEAFMEGMMKENVQYKNRTANADLFLFGNLQRVGINTDGINESKYNDLYNNLHINPYREKALRLFVENYHKIID